MLSPETHAQQHYQKYLPQIGYPSQGEIPFTQNPWHLFHIRGMVGHATLHEPNANFICAGCTPHAQIAPVKNASVWHTDQTEAVEDLEEEVVY